MKKVLLSLSFSRTALRYDSLPHPHLTKTFIKKNIKASVFTPSKDHIDPQRKAFIVVDFQEHKREDGKQSVFKGKDTKEKP